MTSCHTVYRKATDKIRNETDQIDFVKVIDVFANRNARKIRL